MAQHVRVYGHLLPLVAAALQLTSARQLLLSSKPRSPAVRHLASLDPATSIQTLSSNSSRPTFFAASDDSNLPGPWQQGIATFYGGQPDGLVRLTLDPAVLKPDSYQKQPADCPQTLQGYYVPALSLQVFCCCCCQTALIQVPQLKH